MRKKNERIFTANKKGYYMNKNIKYSQNFL
ncbi:23S rRNA (adenine(2058)-N(6))-methyltransferase Erm(B), partial [Butyricicoccus sp. AM28-25]